jgi:hypothetical protein
MSSTTDWIVAASTAAGAVGTVGTLGFLAWQGVSDRREKRRNERQDQAKKVNCWLEVEEIRDTGKLPPELQRTVAAKLYWQNLSDAPISQLEVDCFLMPVIIGGQPNPFAKGVLQEHPEEDRVAATVAPHSESSKYVEYTFRDFGVSPPEGTEPILAWRFTDAASIKWIKTSRGGIYENKPDPERAVAIWAEVFGAALNQGPRPSESNQG